MKLSEVLERALAACENSQAKLAERLGVSGPTVSRWISGKVRPDEWSCVGLAEITGLLPETVLTAAQRDTARLAVIRATGPGAPLPIDRSRFVDLDELDPVRRGVVEDIRQGAAAHGGRLIRTNVHSLRKVAYRAHERQAAA